MNELAVKGAQLPQVQDRSILNVFMPLRYSYVSNGYFQLSMREKLICDVYISTNGNIRECMRQCKEQFKRSPTEETIRAWLGMKSGRRGKEHIGEYLRKVVSERADFNITKEEYVSRTLQMSQGSVKMDKTQAFLWKLVGQAKGFLSEVQAPVNFNQTINILQADGRR